VLKAKVWLVAKRVLGLDLGNHSQVLDPYAESTVFVKAWLDGYNVAGSKGNLCVLHSGADADGSLVYIEERAHPMARAVSVIESFALRRVLVAFYQVLGSKLTQRNCRARQSSAKPVVLLGKMASSSAM
jgi:hypothetical protein